MTAIPPLPAVLWEPLVRAALAEDLGLGGDLTAEATIAEGTHARGALVARSPGTLAGLAPALAVFRILDPHVAAEPRLCDGDAFAAGAVLATVAGDARSIVSAERTALNLLTHLCGIATATRAYVDAVGGAPCAIAETRKTLPGLRALQKYAVRAGGGRNHRLRLDDAVLVKDNHVAAAGGVTAAVRSARARVGHLMRVEVEVDTLEQLDELLGCGSAADVVLLDNFSLEAMREAVRRVAGRLTVEASGGIALERVPAVAATGVDVISVGALTHSVTALDIGLDFEP